MMIVDAKKRERKKNMNRKVKKKITQISTIRWRYICHFTSDKKKFLKYIILNAVCVYFFFTWKIMWTK